MKIYTEEQVNKAMLEYILYPNTPRIDIINSLTPIKIPSEEEIVQHSKEEPDNFDIETSSRLGKYVAGAIWMRNKILGGIK